MPKPRQVAVAIPIVLPWLLSPVEVAALDIPERLATVTNEPVFLLCSSRKHPKRFLFSKGGIEKDEDAEAAALREGWEEGTQRAQHLAARLYLKADVRAKSAGFRGVSLQPLSTPIEDTRPHKHAPESDTTPRAVYHFFLVLVTSLSKEWPERHERERKWFNTSEVLDATSWKVEVEDAMRHMPKDMTALEKLVQSRQKIA